MKMQQKLCSLLIIGVLLSASSMAQECPPPGEGFGLCDEACSSNSDCSDGQLCCSNGCGHRCMTPVEDPCATVRCAAPNCSEVAAGTITPKGQCCPVCACAATDGTMVAAGTSFMNDCNTCNCGPTGVAGCTRLACPPTTEPTTPTPTTDASTMPTSSPTDCPVEGQVRIPCASPCNVTCANMDTVLICPTICVTNGCQCVNGTVIDEQSNTCVLPAGCPTGRSQTCPTVQSTNEENCVDECSSDDDCQYDRICCSNGCGGHSCSDSVEMCELIQCDWPVCEDGAQPVTSPFSCCPFCPTTPPPQPSGCTASDGTSVDVGETYMDQCNTCRCLEGGIGACTRIACRGCTLANGSWIGVGETYMKECNTCTCTDQDVDVCTEIDCSTDQDCPVGGQIRVDCASPCNTTCANMNTLLVCPAVCVINGCQCPSGMVIDEQSNTCVAPAACPTTEACPVEGQVRIPCASPCSVTCANMDTALICPTVCVTNGCQCVNGTVIDEQSNTCVTRSKCPSTGCTLADGSWVAIGDTYKKDCNTCTCTGQDVGICTEKACVKPGDQDTLDGADSGTTTLFAGVITSLLCGLLSVFL